MKWRLLATGCRSGSENMAVDEALMVAHARGDSPPTLRFYGWSPPALTLGYFQDPEAVVDFDACRRLGIDVVRRPTGGRAVLHGREATYSLVAAEDNPAVRGTVAESYLRLSRGLVLGLGGLGAVVAINGSGTSAAGGAACFDSPSIYELTAGGRKLAGSAQCRKWGCVLQHGALPLSMDTGVLFKILRFPSESEREYQLRTFSSKATCLEEVLGRPVSLEEVIDALARGFAGALGMDLEPGGLTDGEARLARELAGSKYRPLQENIKAGKW